MQKIVIRPTARNTNNTPNLALAAELRFTFYELRRIEPEKLDADYSHIDIDIDDEIVYLIYDRQEEDN